MVVTEAIQVERTGPVISLDLIPHAIIVILTKLETEREANLTQLNKIPTVHQLYANRTLNHAIGWVSQIESLTTLPLISDLKSRIPELKKTLKTFPKKKSRSHVEQERYKLVQTKLRRNQRKLLQYYRGEHLSRLVPAEHKVQYRVYKKILKDVDPNRRQKLEKRLQKITKTQSKVFDSVRGQAVHYLLALATSFPVASRVAAREHSRKLLENGDWEMLSQHSFHALLKSTVATSILHHFDLAKDVPTQEEIRAAFSLVREISAYDKNPSTTNFSKLYNSPLFNSLDAHQKAIRILSINGLGLEAAEDLSHRWGSTRDRSGKGYLATLLKNASQHAKKDPGYLEALKQAEHANLHNWLPPATHESPKGAKWMNEVILKKQEENIE